MIRRPVMVSPSVSTQLSAPAAIIRRFLPSKGPRPLSGPGQTREVYRACNNPGGVRQCLYGPPLQRAHQSRLEGPRRVCRPPCPHPRPSTYETHRQLFSGWSGVRYWLPLTPSSNQTRTTPLLNISEGSGAMPGMAVLPSPTL